MRSLALLALLFGGCGPEPPSIRMLAYTPNAGFVAPDETMINGSFLYSDPDQDVSQWVAELSDPNNNLVARTPPTPGQSVSQGITGTANFTLTFTAGTTGLYHFSVWLVDLAGHESNHLSGEIRIATKAPYDPNNNP